MLSTLQQNYLVNRVASASSWSSETARQHRMWTHLLSRALCKSSSSITCTTLKISSAPCMRKPNMFRLHLLLDTHSQEENNTFLQPSGTIPSPNTEGGLSGTSRGHKMPWASHNARRPAVERTCLDDLNQVIYPKRQAESSSCANPAGLCLPQGLWGKAGRPAH